MRKYERELIERCLDVLQEASAQAGEVRGLGVRLALWALRPYCTRDNLDRFWAVTEAQNPMYEKVMREQAFTVLRKATAPLSVVRGSAQPSDLRD